MSAQVIQLTPEAWTKRCTKCGETKPLGDFPPMKWRPLGRGPWCRACVAVQQRDYYVRRGKLLRVGVIDRNGRTVERIALPAAAEQLGIVVAPPTCVCGHTEYFHPRAGACSCGNCPEWFERGL